jgi:hypothetical protein
MTAWATSLYFVISASDIVQKILFSTSQRESQTKISRTKGIMNKLFEGIVAVIDLSIRKTIRERDATMFSRHILWGPVIIEWLTRMDGVETSNRFSMLEMVE